MLAREMAVYPFTRLEEERRRLLAAGVDVIDFGKGDPNEPTDPLIRQALVEALPERAPYPLAQGLPELREAASGWLERRFGVAVDPDTEIVPTYGSKEAIFSLAQVLGTGGRVVAFGEPAYPVYERGALFAGARVQTLPLRRENDFLPDLAELDDDVALVWVNYPHNPTGAVAPREFYDELAEAAERQDFVVGSDEAYTELWFDDPPPSALQAADRSRIVVFQTLSKRSSMTGYRSGLRRRPARDRRGTEGVPSDRGDGAAGVRAAGLRRGLERRAPRRGDPRALPREAGRADPCDRGARLGDRCERGDDVPLGRRARPRRAARARAHRLSGRDVRPERRGLRPLRARADAGGVRTGGGDPAGGGVMDVEDTIAALDRGEVRVAEKVDGDWRVNEEAKAAILEYFRVRKVEPIEVGPFEYLDKIPLKHDHAERGVRVVPPATARYGSFLSPGVILMPSYVNIGAWVGPNTMVDTWATVGSCAQIGADVHLAGGVGVGGVLEPLQARPVIVEDGAFVGSRCILTEGVVIGERAVLAPNVSLTGSVPVIDVTGPEPVEHRGYVPPRAVVVPGTRPKEFPAGTWEVACALVVGWRSEKTDLKTSLNDVLREFEIGS